MSFSVANCFNFEGWYYIEGSENGVEWKTFDFDSLI